MTKGDSYRELALLVAEGDLSEVEIAEKFSCSSEQLARVFERPSFRRRVALERQLIWQDVCRGLLSPGVRFAAVLDRWDATEDLIECQARYGAERDGLAKYWAAPGAATGLLEPRMVLWRSGFFESWSIDAALFDEQQAIARMLARYSVDPEFLCLFCTPPGAQFGRAPRMPSLGSLRRLRILNELWQDLRDLITQRAEDARRAQHDRPSWQRPPVGAETGLLACQIKMGRRGIYERWHLDLPTLRNLRSLETAAARYRGEAGFVCWCSGRRRAWREEPEAPVPTVNQARELMVAIGRRQSREFAADWSALAA